MDKKSSIIVEQLDATTSDALIFEQQEASKLLKITNESPKEVVAKILDYVENFLSENHTDDEIDGLSVRMGALWGEMVVKEYSWIWCNIDFGNGSMIYVLSPKEYYCCNPLAFLHKILKGKNRGLDGKNDNTILLLFNMLKGIEEQPPANKYQTLS